ncbi:MAG: hypothetical protein KC561_03715, partial [Myxococcales bacterium]|nr:hypothetical protein [Myxococcales bacterium]
MSELPPTLEPVVQLSESDLGFEYPIDKLSRALERRKSVQAVGLDGAFLAATLASATVRSGRPTVIVTPTLAIAEELAQDLQAFGVGRVDQELLVVPPPDVSPYGEISPDRLRIMGRLNTQFRLAMGDDVRVILLPVAGAMRKLAPWSEIEKASQLFSVGDSVDYDELRAMLVRGGYTSVRVVEDPGTFAIRGGIIDVFSPYNELPLRLDLWGDEIESIRTFDPQTQRTADKVDSLFVFPVREEIVTPETLKHAREQLLEQADRIGLPSARVTEVLNDLESGYNFFGIEALLPALYPLQSSLDLLPAEANWVVIEREHVEQVAAQIWNARDTEFKRYVEEQEGFAFPPEAFFLSPESVLGAVRDHEAVEISPPGSDTTRGLIFSS